MDAQQPEIEGTAVSARRLTTSRHDDLTIANDTTSTLRVKKVGKEGQDDKAEEVEPVYWSREFGKNIICPVWLDDDILAFGLASEIIDEDEDIRQPIDALAFFSIAKRGLIGHIQTDIVYLKTSGNQIYAFTPTNNLYVITVNSSVHKFIDTQNVVKHSIQKESIMENSPIGSKRKDFQRDDEAPNKKKPKICFM